VYVVYVFRGGVWGSRAHEAPAPFRTPLFLYLI